MGSKNWSNLTQAIEYALPIDWAEFGSRSWKAFVLDQEGNKIKGWLLHRPDRQTPDNPHGWEFLDTQEKDYREVSLLTRSWYGSEGWSLWIKGAFPRLPKPEPKPVWADSLPVGTCFYSEPEGHCIVFESSSGEKRVLCGEGIGSIPASDAEVTEVFGVGTFQPGEQKKKP